MADVTADLPKTPVADEWLGTSMLYSSGTTGRPKGIIRPLPEEPPKHNLALFDFLTKLWHYREGMVYLSPAPLYHSAPQAAVNLTIRMGGTAIIMENFDPERYLQLVPRWGITHTQLVPTMFSRMLELPEEVRGRYDLSSLEIAIQPPRPALRWSRTTSSNGGGRSSTNITAPPKASALPPATARNGLAIAAPSARCCSATFTFSTRTCSRA